MFFIYSESRLLIRSDKPSAHDKLKMALVIGHEVAQQWFGNLVTIIINIIASSTGIFPGCYTL